MLEAPCASFTGAVPVQGPVRGRQGGAKGFKGGGCRATKLAYGHAREGRPRSVSAEKLWGDGTTAYFLKIWTPVHGWEATAVNIWAMLLARSLRWKWAWCGYRRERLPRLPAEHCAVHVHQGSTRWFEPADAIRKGTGCADTTPCCSTGITAGLRRGYLRVR